MRPEKASIVSDLSEKINRSPFMLVTDYQRMKVTQFGELRNRLMPAGAEVRVVKNSFLKRAMEEGGFPDVGEQLTGQTAIVLGESDVAPVAKILKTFAAEFKIAALKVGVVDKVILSTKDVEALAELPSREVLLSQLLGLLLMPATSLVRVLNEPATAFARLLKAKGEQGGGAEAAAPKEEAPAAVAEPEAAPAAESPKAEAPVAEAPKSEASAADAPASEATAPAEAAPAASSEEPSAGETLA